jgi:hypothetical protein
MVLDGLCLGLFTMDCVWDYLRWFVFGVTYNGFEDGLRLGLFTMFLLDGCVRRLILE